MAINQVRQAIEDAQRELEEATAAYEAAMHEAERNLREALGEISEQPEPSKTVTVDREKFEKMAQIVDAFESKLKENGKL